MAIPNLTDDVEKNNKEATRIKFDFIPELPQVVVKNILFYLTPEDLRSALSCCLKWRFVLRLNYYWKMLCDRDGYFEVEESQKSEYYTNFLKRHNYWQGVYWYNWTLRENWVKGHYKEITHKIQEPDSNILWLFFDDIFVVRSMINKKLSVYNLKTAEFKCTIYSIREEEGNIFKSGKYLCHFVKNKWLTVWDYENEIIVLNEFWDHVSNVTILKNLFVLEAEDNKKFQVFNMESRRNEYEFGKIFKNLVIMDGRIIFVTRDHIINILTWNEKSRITLLCCLYPGTGNFKFMVKGDLLFSFCQNNQYIPNMPQTLCVWNISTKKRLYSLSLGNLYMDEPSFINNYVYLNYFQNTTTFGDILSERFELVDCTTGIVSASVANVETSSSISNGEFIIACRSNSLSLWCLKERDFICDLNIGFKHYPLCGNKMVMTKSKLFYAIKGRHGFIILHRRDYEI